MERTEPCSELSGKVTCFPVPGRADARRGKLFSFNADLPGVTGLPGVVGKLSENDGDDGTAGAGSRADVRTGEVDKGEGSLGLLILK